jgi:hypothetical protein
MTKFIYGIYEVEETFKPDGKWAGYTYRTISPIGNRYGYIAKTDIQIKVDANKSLTP